MPVYICIPLFYITCGVWKHFFYKKCDSKKLNALKKLRIFYVKVFYYYYFNTRKTL